MKPGKYAWPTDAITKRQFDRWQESTLRRHEKQAEKIKGLTVRMRTAEAQLSQLIVSLQALGGEEE